MSNFHIKKDDWNRIIDDIKKIETEYYKDPVNTRIYFYGIEVSYITCQRATEENENEWLTIWIYAVGKIPQNPQFQRDSGIEHVCIAVLDKWHMDEASIRDRLSHLEVRKIDIVKQFK